MRGLLEVIVAVEDGQRSGVGELDLLRYRHRHLVVPDGGTGERL